MHHKEYVGKRLFDLLTGCLGLIVFAPVSTVIVLLIKLESKGPVIHWSRRIGQYNRPFYMPKFRTMTVDTPQQASNELQNPSQYITRVGSVLRKTSLDEIPQFISVVTGQMSLVGPRPALYNEHALIALRTSKDIHAVKPGLTGLAQVMGRDFLSVEEKVAYDHEYSINMSFKQDLFIVLKTLGLILSSKNVRH